ncbi:hypothetical protein JXA32_05830 [Candidatus Sumerlaeota bacterium]|nr:hypothetical protein [Candidatus Sumerlaeota bacterium]
MKMLRNIFFAILAYVVVAIISGLILMHGQGDTPSISIRYGLQYAVQGGGITDVIRNIRLGEFHSASALAALIQILAATGVFCILQLKNQKSIGTISNTPVERHQHER